MDRGQLLALVGQANWKRRSFSFSVFHGQMTSEHHMSVVLSAVDSWQVYMNRRHLQECLPRTW